MNHIHCAINIEIPFVLLNFYSLCPALSPDFNCRSFVVYLVVVVYVVCNSYSRVFELRIIPINRFSAAEDEQLIEMVDGHSILWDMADCDFKNIKKNLMWNEIGKMVNNSGRLFVNINLF